MATDKSSQLPDIFLSHSGEDKGFVWHLYRELLKVNHKPFFDQDAGVDVLPKGIHFPPRILEACRACKLGIVVLSHNYIESLWPMLELQQFFFHNPPSPNIIPLFYKLSPADLSKAENLTRWHAIWREKEASWKDKVQGMHMAQPGMSMSSLVSQPATLDISLWPEALERLRNQSGQILPNNKDEHAFIQAIVSNICKMLPPPPRSTLSMGGHYQGAERIQQTIHELFEQQQQRHDEELDDCSRSMPITVGLYGVGGSGKTIVCKFMVSFYDKDYPGRSCFLEFPSDKNEKQLLLHSMKEILAQHDYVDEETLRKVNKVEQAMPYLQHFFKRYRVFLVIDNVWDWALIEAKEILAMDYVQGSRLLVTARSKGVLENLSARRHFAMTIHNVPSISETEAVEALKAYSFSTLQGLANAEALLSRLARLCFFGEQCHPLLLKALGGKLRPSGGSCTEKSQALDSVLSRLESLKISGDEIEEIMIVLRASYDALDVKLRELLLKLGTCVPKKYFGEKCLSKAIEWLSMVNGCGFEDIRAQMNDLEYHGLIKINEETVVIHDLQMMMIEKIVQKNNNVPKCHFFEGDATSLSESKWKKLRYVHGFGKEADRLKVFSLDWCMRIGLRKGIYNVLDDKYTLDLEVLRLSNMSPRTATGIFFLKYVRHLRFLELHMVYGVQFLVGWEKVPNLVSVVLSKCEVLQEIDAMTNVLTSLRHISFKCLGKWKNTMKLRKLYHCTALETCVLSSNPLMFSFPSLTLSKLRELDLSDCKGLQSMEGSECCLTALEELSLAGCVSLERIPDLRQLVKLRSLQLKGCVALKKVKVGEATLTSLEYLSLQYGRTQFFIGMSCSALCISAFTNLRAFYAQGDSGVNGSSSSARRVQLFEARGMRLPANLEELSLCGFKGAQEMPDLSELVNLKRLELEGWPTSVTASLGQLAQNLESLSISP